MEIIYILSLEVTAASKSVHRFLNIRHHSETIYPSRCNKCIFFDGMRRFLLPLNTIDIICLIYSNICGNKIVFNANKRSFTDFKYYLICADIWMKLV